MKNRGTVYVGILLIAAGFLFLVAQMTGRWIGWAGIWPFLILLVGAAFWMPIFVWWERRQQLAGLAMPGTIIMTNGLILLFQNTTGLWGTWSYLWSLELIAVGLGLLALYVLGRRERGLLVAAAVVGGIGLTFFFIFATAFSRFFRLLGAVVLILTGVLMILSRASQRLDRNIPNQ
ncbi:MAG TPA: hypothetical protein VMX14_08140 [Anaerolineae bacterium]|nr:hypothetical protein [Anaerolineae bacterium]